MNEYSTKDLINEIIKENNNKKAENVRCYDLLKSEWITDYVIIIGAKNKIHCKALQEATEQTVTKNKNNKNNIDLYSHPRIKGKAESGWVIIDLNSIICHCITEDLREKYNLDTLMERKTTTILY